MDTARRDSEHIFHCVLHQKALSIYTLTQLDRKCHDKDPQEQHECRRICIPKNTVIVPAPMYSHVLKLHHNEMFRGSL